MSRIVKQTRNAYNIYMLSIKRRRNRLNADPDQVGLIAQDLYGRQHMHGNRPDAIFGNLSANTREFLNTAVRLLSFLHKNEISTDDIYGEIAGDEVSAVLCARELGKAGLFYIEKYKPQYVCSIRDDFLRDIKKVSGLVYNSFARRISDYIGNVRKIKPEELAYICSMRDDMKLTDGTAFAIIREFTDMDSRLTAYDITSMLDMNMSWTNISTVQANVLSVIQGDRFLP